jgi:hypothetical protein
VPGAYRLGIVSVTPAGRMGRNIDCCDGSAVVAVLLPRYSVAIAVWWVALGSGAPE